MSSSSSSDAGEYSDHDFSVHGDAHTDDKGFDGWGLDDEQITFDTSNNNDDDDNPEETGNSATKPALVVDDGWPSFDEPTAVVMTRSVPVGQNEEEEDDEIFEEEEQDEDVVVDEEETNNQAESLAQKKAREEMEARQAEAVAAEKKRRLDEAKRALEKSKTDSEREKREAAEAEKKRREEEEKVRKAFREQQEALQKAEKERKEAEEAAAAVKAKKPTAISPMKQQPAAPAVAPKKNADVPPIPKETIHDLNRRARETHDNQEEKVPQQKAPVSTPTAKEIDDALAKHLNEKGQFQKAARDQKVLDRLRAALDEFHQYAKTPIAERDYTFQNEFFNASSKDFTKEGTLRLQSIVDAAKKLRVGEKNEARLYYEVSPFDPSVEPLLKQLSHALCAYITSQAKVGAQQRRGVASALIADVIYKSDPENMARTAQILAVTIADILCSEAAALKIAELVSEGEKKKKFQDLRVLILGDVISFINSISASTGAASKIVNQIAAVSSSFEELAYRFSAINTEGKEKHGVNNNKRMSHGLVLSILLRQYVLYNPAVRNFTTDNDDARASLTYQSNIIVPDLIMYPEAMYDVLAGMLDGVRSSFNIVSKTEDRTRVMLIWNEIKGELNNQVGYLLRAKMEQAKVTRTAQQQQQTKTVTFETKKQTTSTNVASSIKQAPEEKFLRRFEMEDED